MAKTTSSFVAEIKMITEYGGERFLDNKFDIANRIYNVGVRHYRTVVNELRKDVWFQKAFSEWKNSDEDSDEHKEWSKELDVCISAYGLNEYDIHKYLGKGRTEAFQKGIGVNIVQKVATALYGSIKKAVFSGTEIHFRKYGQTSSFEDKKASSGIIFNKVEHSVKVMGRVFPLKKIRKKDYWLHEALIYRVKYCRIVRKPFRTGYKYYLQLVLEGESPKKIMSGHGLCGIDEGVSTVAYTNDNDAVFSILAEGIEKYDKGVVNAAAKYERRKRMANPECYNKNGTIKKGSRFTNHTKGMQRALFELKDAYRKKTAYIRNCHGHLANNIIKGCDTIVKEPMNFKALQRRSKGAAERSKTASVIRTKSGTKKQVYKYKKKKRYGRSINKRSPGLFNSLLESKAVQYNVEVTDVNIRKYRASQYDHVTDTYKKPGLSERGKRIGGKRVQRDLYSSFLLKCLLDEEHPDRRLCETLFPTFLKNQGKAVSEAIKKCDPTGNFGIAFFKN